MDNTVKRQLTRIGISFVLFLIPLFASFEDIYDWIFYLISYLIIGYDVILKALKNLFRGKLFDENFLMTIATLGAFFIGEYQEGVAVMLFYQVGELFQHYAVEKSRKSIASLMDIRAEYANVCRDNDIMRVDPSEVEPGEIIVSKPGEKIPLDGVVIEGEAMLNTMALTGESVLRKVRTNDDILSGCVNQDGLLKIRVSRKFEDSTVSKILELVENASSRKSKSENFIRKFAKYYTPIVVVIAFLLAIIPPLVIKGSSFDIWLYRSLSFLVVSCPCALVISIPLSFFGGLGSTSKIGVLVKGSNYLEALAHTEFILCDKTGTLTEGIFKVQKIEAKGISDDELLKYAAYAESFSNHPIAFSLKEAYLGEVKKSLVTKVKEFAGKGVLATVGSKQVLVGNEKLMEERGIDYLPSSHLGTIVYVAIDHEFKGFILIADKIKDDSYRAIEEFRANQVKKIVMLTGDHEKMSKKIATELRLDDYYAELLPQDKVVIMEQFLKQKSEKGKLLFVGDGINDAPVLALADIGIAMGGDLSSDAAIESADVVIMTDELSKIATSIQISRKTMKIVKENVVFAIMIKVLVLVLSALGMTTLWIAVFADVGVSVLAILNALRALRVKKAGKE